MLYEAAWRCRAPPGGKVYPCTSVKEKHLDTHEAAGALSEYTFQIDGMTCASCSGRVERAQESAGCAARKRPPLAAAEK
jgi:hypothetical protein